MARQIEIRCTKAGLAIRGARNVGSTSDAAVSTKATFMRVCEHWWNTYCESGEASGGERTAGDVRYRVVDVHGAYNCGSLEDLEANLKRQIEKGDLFTEIKRVIRLESRDIELPGFVEEYNSLIRTQGRKKQEGAVA